MTDAELVKMMCDVWDRSPTRAQNEDVMKTILTRIRPYLEAHGIEMAADDMEQDDAFWNEKHVKRLRDLARRHAIGIGR